MTAQEIFDTAAVGLLKQGKKSISAERAQCQYRGDGGTKFSVGFTIPDEVYVPEMEGETITELAAKYADCEWMKGHVGLLEQLQAIHDNEDIEEWTDALRNVALKYNLSDAVIQ